MADQITHVKNETQETTKHKEMEDAETNKNDRKDDDDHHHHDRDEGE